MSEFRCGNPSTMTDEELAEVYALLPQIEAWINAVKKQAMSAAEINALPGYKIVAGRSLRKWINEDDAVAELAMAGLTADQLYIRKAVSVAQAEKVIGKAAFKKVAEKLVTRTEGKPVLAPLSDKRAAINAASEFEPVK